MPQTLITLSASITAMPASLMKRSRLTNTRFDCGLTMPIPTIVWASDTGVYRVSANGGTAQKIVDQGAIIYFDPVFLPDGDHYLLSAFDAQRIGTILVRSLSDATERDVHRDATNAAWIDSGHLLYIRGDALMAQRFDANNAQLQSRIAFEDRGRPDPGSPAPWPSRPDPGRSPSSRASA